MIYIILGLLGMAFGSFVNAFVWRVYKQDFSKTKDKSLKKKDLSVLRGRSMCVHCHHTLAWYDLVPVFSWLSLKGTCRYCKKPIHWQYPIVELTTAALFVGSYLFWPLSFGVEGVVLLGLWLMALVLLIALGVFDAKWQFLPDRIVFPLIGISIVFASIRLLYPGVHSLGIIGLGASVVIAGGLFYGLFVLSKGKLIGGGDGKLGIALGLLLGTPGLALLMLFVASLLGSLAALPGYIKNKKNNRIAFGPFLITATIICFFFGASIIEWYLGVIGVS